MRWLDAHQRIFSREGTIFFYWKSARWLAYRCVRQYLPVDIVHTLVKSWSRYSLFHLFVAIYSDYNNTDGDPGPFCLARSGLYIRAKNVWIVFLVFKGSDLHSGFAPVEDPQAHQRWVDENVSTAWNVAGPQNRVGYVSYIGSVPSDRLGSINITPLK